MKWQVTVPKINDNSAENLRRLRGTERLSRRDLLDLLSDQGVEMHETTLRRIEEGVQPMKVVEAIAFSRVFGVSLEELIAAVVDPVSAEIRAKLSKAKAEHQQAVRAEGWWLSLCEDLANGIPTTDDSPAVQEAREYLDSTSEERKARERAGWHVPR